MEIERKFLVKDDSWRAEALPGVRYVQGYMRFSKGVARARVAGEKAYLTIKGETKGASRLEYEYPIPAEDALVLLENLCEGPKIEKTRHIVPFKGFRWELDVFSGENEGLLVAELELESEDEQFPKPPWLGEEVTGDLRYSNSNLSLAPFSKWSRGD
jgi:CYTH domain-containing protein